MLIRIAPRGLPYKGRMGPLTDPLPRRLLCAHGGNPGTRHGEEGTARADARPLRGTMWCPSCRRPGHTRGQDGAGGRHGASGEGPAWLAPSTWCRGPAVSVSRPRGNCGRSGHDGWIPPRLHRGPLPSLHRNVRAWPVAHGDGRPAGPHPAPSPRPCGQGRRRPTATAALPARTLP